MILFNEEGEHILGAELFSKKQKTHIRVSPLCRSRRNIGGGRYGSELRYALLDP